MNYLFDLQNTQLVFISIFKVLISQRLCENVYKSARALVLFMASLLMAVCMVATASLGWLHLLPQKANITSKIPQMFDVIEVTAATLNKGRSLRFPQPQPILLFRPPTPN